ncbi:tetratricopeptide repeat protein [Gilvimarinus xylanilyticus]|uniref:Tetratricopeptide repeat protein n=1 Tax=Gilvimarinus xylanilyticus TaxID=2944139 RepID=A0A9X2KVJ0_9GAMM|nr:tetratricopeptide repeat protein [Gilvimarinus xylanilyticus]MCP8898095.1 hypothetical protein [Gilvimarinus xylanilyticus]
MKAMTRTAKQWLLIAFSLILGVAALPGNAKPYTPSHSDSVVVDWGEPVSTAASLPAQSAADTLRWAARQVVQAKKPGQSFRYALAQQALDELTLAQITGAAERVELWRLRASLAQHSHHFDEAQDNLQQVLALAPDHIEARLMAARIALLSGEVEPAEQHCQKLLGVSDLLTASACLLEVRSVSASAEQAYPALKRLVERSGWPDDARRPWLEQMLASMAERQGKFEEAAQWLSLPVGEQSVSYLSQWAELQLRLDKPRRVMHAISSLEIAPDNLDDVLLLQMALAENMLGEENQWQSRMERRVALREARNDWQHAAHLSRYYLDIDPDAQRALFWARRNIKAAREPYDKELLRRAEQAALTRNQSMDRSGGNRS